jgi:hypothetical protein
MDVFSVEQIVNCKKYPLVKHQIWLLNLVEKILNAAHASKDEITIVIPGWAQPGSSALVQRLGMNFARVAKVENQFVISWKGAKAGEGVPFASLFTSATLRSIFEPGSEKNNGAFKMAKFCMGCGYHEERHRQLGCKSDDLQRVEFRPCSVCAAPDHLTWVCPKRSGGTPPKIEQDFFAPVAKGTPPKTVTLEEAERIAKAFGLVRCHLCSGDGQVDFCTSNRSVKAQCPNCLGIGGYFVGKPKCLFCSKPLDYPSSKDSDFTVCCKQVYYKSDPAAKP